MRRSKKLTGVLSVLLFCFILTSCGRQARDKLLRAFIDGVPPAEEEKPVIEGETEKEKKELKREAAAPQAPTQFFHQPFLENQCGSCHDTKFSQKIVSQGKELCFSCHDDFAKDKKVVHYPVSEGGCGDCHDPHQSPNKFILKRPIPEICFTCHAEEEIRAIPVHEGQNMCTDCHDAHASNEEKLLK